MVVMAARPDVKVDARPIAVVMVVPGAMPMAAVPVASVPYLHRAFGVHRFEASGYAAHRRGLSRYCHEAEGQRGGDGCEQTTAYHEFELPCFCGRGASAKKAQRRFRPTQRGQLANAGLAQQFRARPKDNADTRGAFSSQLRCDERCLRGGVAFRS